MLILVRNGISRKHRVRCNYCGADKSVSHFILMIRLLLFGRVMTTCKECGYTSTWILCHHIVHDTMDKDEKMFNKHYDEFKRRIGKYD